MLNCLSCLLNTYKGRSCVGFNFCETRSEYSCKLRVNFYWKSSALPRLNSYRKPCFVTPSTSLYAHLSNISFIDRLLHSRSSSGILSLEIFRRTRWCHWCAYMRSRNATFIAFYRSCHTKFPVIEPENFLWNRYFEVARTYAGCGAKIRVNSLFFVTQGQISTRNDNSQRVTLFYYSCYETRRRMRLTSVCEGFCRAMVTFQRLSLPVDVIAATISADVEPTRKTGRR